MRKKELNKSHLNEIILVSTAVNSDILSSRKNAKSRICRKGQQKSFVYVHNTTAATAKIESESTLAN